ncbi:uncharacterized protein METZ01_LOCUS329436, partial [marine metagenome]
MKGYKLEPLSWLKEMEGEKNLIEISY